MSPMPHATQGLLDLYAKLPYTFKRFREGLMAPVQVKERSLRRNERLEARVTRAQKRLIERAAALKGSSITDFVVASAQEAAARAIRDQDVLQLREEGREVFIRAILNPPAPTRAARAAAARYKRNRGRR